MLWCRKLNLHTQKRGGISENLLAAKMVLLPAIDFVGNILPTSF
jgi:hypothetical protein